MTKEAIEQHLAGAVIKPIDENQESAPDSAEILKRTHRSRVDIEPFEEEKEPQGTLDNINIQINGNKSLNINLEESNNLKRRDKRSNSNNKSRLNIMDKRKISSHRDASGMQSELIDIEENVASIRGMDVSGNIGAKVNRDKTSNFEEKNPLNKYKNSPDVSPEKSQ